VVVVSRLGGRKGRYGSAGWPESRATLGRNGVTYRCVQFVLFVPLLSALACGGNPEPRVDPAERRSAMVEQQLVARGITDLRVLATMRDVPRHEFVPESLRDFAYEDSPLPIGSNQTISQPYIVAAMTELLQPKPSDVVLEIGTGSGYQAAVLARLVARVYSIEILPELARSAAEVLARTGVTNVEVITGDGHRGLPERAPFDGIIVTAAPKTVPPALVEQLAVGARLVIPVGDHYQELLVLEKTEDGVTERKIFPVRFVPMTK
jgi:protein-L-isoaspartate(D-aspartate) O-methyltransferase